MVSIGSYTQSEIQSQPDIWKTVLEDHAQTARALPLEFRNAAGKYFLVTGCGSTHYLSVTVHCELRHLHAHVRLAQEMGIPKESIFLLENGAVLELRGCGPIVEKVPNEDVFVAGSSVGEIGPMVMREPGGAGARRFRARDGAGQRREQGK